MEAEEIPHSVQTGEIHPLSEAKILDRSDCRISQIAKEEEILQSLTSNEPG